MDTLKGALEKQKVDAEQKIAELSSSNTELCSKLAVYTEETERGQSALQMYREQVSINLDVALNIFGCQDRPTLLGFRLLPACICIKKI